MKTLGIDMDDVLMDFNRSLQEYHNHKYGTRHTREDTVSYNLEKLWK